VKAFVHKYIQSVEHLEVLLLLYRAPEKTWTAQSVARELRADGSSIKNRLSDHTKAGLLDELQNEGSAEYFYRFRSYDPDVNEIVSQLGAAYRERRFRIIDAIFSKPNDKLRLFADAFKYRKD
jgi:hypothetical protein